MCLICETICLCVEFFYKISILFDGIQSERCSIYLFYFPKNEAKFAKLSRKVRFNLR